MLIRGDTSRAFTSAAPGAIEAAGGVPAAGYAQGMALAVGTGRVYVSGDADMFTALVRRA